MATVHADACCITGATAGFTYFQITLQHQFFDETVSKTETKIFDFLHHGCVRYLLVGAWLRHACGYGCCCICWEYVCIIIASSSSRSGGGSTAAASTVIPSSKLIPSPTISGRQHVETWLGCRYHERNVCWNVRAVLAFYRTGDQAARPSIHPRHRYAGETEAHHTECVQPPPFSVLLFFSPSSSFKTPLMALLPRLNAWPHGIRRQCTSCSCASCIVSEIVSIM